jgi:DNA-binding transcriptional ArsR family regulator
MSHGGRMEARAGAVDDRMARQVAETMQALSAPARVTILAHLRASPSCVGELAEVASLEQSAVSHHLRVLRHLGLVVGERRGRQVFYSLHDAHVGALVDEAVYHVEHIRLAAGQPS